MKMSAWCTLMVSYSSKCGAVQLAVVLVGSGGSYQMVGTRAD